MTPTELRRMAERCRDNSVAQNAAIWRGCSPHEWEWTQEQQEGMARYCLEASHCVDHVLFTVREDDGEEVRHEDIILIDDMQLSLLFHYDRYQQEWVLDLRGMQPIIRTRGQLRRLIEGLGVG